MSANLDLTLLKNCLKNPKLLCLLTENSLWYLLSNSNKALEARKGNLKFIKQLLNELSFVERKYTIFFDNSSGNLENLTKTKTVIPIKVEGMKFFTKLCRIENFNKNRKVNEKFPIYEGMVKYFKTLPLKARNLGWFLWLRNKEICQYDEFSGLKNAHFKICKNGILNGYVKNLILDWDRTLTNFEGVLTYKNSELQDIRELMLKRKDEIESIAKEKGILNFLVPLDVKIKDIASLYFGKNYTKGKLRKLWKLCKNYDVKIYILTANPAASKNSKHRHLFLALLSETGLELRDEHLLCSKDYKGDKQWIIKNILKFS